MGSAPRPEVAPPADVVDAAERRSEARAARDWATADELRAEIEAAGWKVTDSGTDYRLEPAHPADEEVAGEIRYGRSDAVPSRLDEPATGVATVVLAIESGDPDGIETASAMARNLPDASGFVVVGDAIDDATAVHLRALEDSVELVRTSAPLGQAAALNAGIRRATGQIVVVLDPSIRPTGDIISPLGEALRDPTVAVAGPFGLSSADLRRFTEVVPTDRPVEVAAIQGYCMAFRRAEVIERGPLDEGFRFYRNLDIWWSLALRDAGDGVTPRRAVALPNLPLERGEPWAWTTTPEAERDRLSRRNFYRVLDRFRARLDLAVSHPNG